ncbi:hypothetical protein ABPG74_022339 [Tetrahymena malaccensis]
MNIINKYRALKNWIKTSKYGSKYIAFKEKMLDQKLNRELVGEDRMGNKYYQYYSPWGLPTRREIEFANKNSYEMNDLAFYFWLNKREEMPPTEEQIKQYYLDEADRKMKGIEWDNKERKMMEQFYQQRFKIIQQTEVNRRLGLEEDEKDRLLRLEAENQKKASEEQTSQPEGGKDQFEPQKWKPQAKGRRGQQNEEK